MQYKIKSQKQIFLDGEADNWLYRNKKNKKKNNTIKDKIIINIIKKLINNQNRQKNYFLEVGCSNGEFVLKLRKKKKCKVFGLDPSQKGIEELRKRKINCRVGTADNIPYKKKFFFDIIFFNFCLYLCDENDYKKIYQSVDKVLRKNGFIIIFDFFSKRMKKVIYKHDKRIFSIKHDFRKIFEKYKKYECIHHMTYNYSKIFKAQKSNKNDLLSISVMNKKTA